MNVISTPHEECVQLIKRAGDTLALKVVTAQLSPSSSNSISQSLPYRRKGKPFVFFSRQERKGESAVTFSSFLEIDEENVRSVSNRRSATERTADNLRYRINTRA